MPDPKATAHDDVLARDHERGCQGREYACTCGYDAAKDAEIEHLRALVTRLTDVSANLAAELADPGTEAMAAIHCGRHFIYG